MSFEVSVAEGARVFGCMQAEASIFAEACTEAGLKIRPLSVDGPGRRGMGSLVKQPTGSERGVGQ